MLPTRLIVGALLIGLIVGMLMLDEGLSPWYPFSFMLMALVAIGGSYELCVLLGPARQPDARLCHLGIVTIVVSNWLGHLPPTEAWLPHPWVWVLIAFTLFVLAVFVSEMATFREPGRSLERMAMAIFIIAYLGVLPSFLIQLRWLDGRPERGTQALALAIFVPKTCDIGAYFTGRLLGRHKMAPVLSPKKTWEGAAGGLATAIVAAVVLDRVLPGGLLRSNLALEAGFGVTIGMVGMFGDLAESLIKRDCQQKDASQVVPGFGGILDVVDAILFAAPVAYCWLLGAHVN